MAELWTNAATPFVFAIIVLVAGILLVWWAKHWLKPTAVRRIVAWPTIVFGAITAVVGVTLIIGSFLYRIDTTAGLASVERPGELVDIGGRNIHLSCVGDARDDQPTLVLIAGGYGSGLFMAPLQERWAANGGRACFIDRPSTGWSDPVDGIPTIKSIALDFEKAVASSGEAGPFVLVGHSMGGLLAANWAARSELALSGLVVLDPTPVEMMATGGTRRPGGWCYGPEPTLQMAASALGLGQLFPALHPMTSASFQESHASLEEYLPALKAMESRPRSLLAGNRNFTAACFAGYEHVRGAGALGDLPTLSIVQGIKNQPNERQEAEQWSGVSGDFEFENFQRSNRLAAAEYPALSRNGELLRLPPEYGHNFPIEEPDMTIELIGAFVADLSGSAADTTKAGPTNPALPS